MFSSPRVFRSRGDNFPESGGRSYRLGLNREKLAVTQGPTIAMNVLVMNHERLLELLFVVFVYWLQQLLLSIKQGERPRFSILGRLISPA
jgi:IS5 family transposase